MGKRDVTFRDLAGMFASSLFQLVLSMVIWLPVLVMVLVFLDIVVSMIKIIGLFFS